MLIYAARRLLMAIPVLLAASVFAFVLIDISGDPLANLRLLQPPPTPEVMAAEEARLYLDRSTPERYWLWLTGLGGNGDIGLLRGEFGPSVRGNVDIGAEIASRFLVTLRLVLIALMLAIGVAILSGVLSAVKQYSSIDYTLTFVGFVCLAMPTFWLAALIQQGGVWFNNQVGARLFYTVGAASPDTRGLSTWERVTDAAGHMVRPTLALMLTAYAALSRYQRASMLEVLNSDYIRLARAKGLRNHVVMRRHALRTALIPLTTLSLLLVATTLDGAILIETVFQWRGLGTFFVDAVKSNDSYAVLGWLMLSGVIVVTANLIADLLYGVLDPRIRYE